MQNLLFGIVSGSILALAAIGFAMVRQTEGFLNIAHAQFLVLGAFIGVVFVDTLRPTSSSALHSLSRSSGSWVLVSPSCCSIQYASRARLFCYLPPSVSPMPCTES